jgi:hypothetical protein
MGRARPIRVLLVVLATVAGLAIGAPAGAAVAPAKALTIAATPASPVWSQAVKLSASITPRGGGAPRGGTVTFLADDVPLGTATATTRITTLTTRAIPIGTHQLTARYAGDDRTAPGTTAPVAITVGPAPTATTLTSTIDPVATGAAAELRATVRPAAPANTANSAARPAGTVTFTAGSRTGTVRLSANGIAVWRPKLPDGTHTVTATYGGSDLHASSATTTSATVRVAVEGTLDTYHWNEPPIDWRTVRGAPGSTQELMQQITPMTTGRIDRVSFHIFPTGDPETPAGDLQISIQTLDEWGLPTGTVLGHGVLSAAAVPPFPPSEVEVELDQLAPVQRNVRYGMIISMAAEDPDVDGSWRLTTPGEGYSGGALATSVDGAMWQVDSGDLNFRTWVLPNLP